MMMTEDIKVLKRNALLSAAYDTSLQISLRTVSFVLNAFILRHVDEEIFAIMSVRLYLLYSTGLLLSREAFRRAALSSRSGKEIHLLVNLIWYGTAVSLLVSLAGWLIWVYVMAEPPQHVLYYRAATACVLMSMVLEVTAEVPFILAELHLWAKTKVIIEGVMQLLRSVLVAISILIWPSGAVLLFGLSYITGSIFYVAAYYGVFIKAFSDTTLSGKILVTKITEMLPTVPRGSIIPAVDKEMSAIARGFFKQGWLKEALTEGELYLMSLFHLVSYSQQGIYQVVNNLASLAARLVFRSLESAAYKFFAQMLTRGKPVVDQNENRVRETAWMLKKLLKNLTLLSLIIICFGWSYSNFLLWLYGGSRLSEAGSVLMRAQCLYIALLAINGVTEAYTYAAMDEAQLSQHNRVLVVFSGLYIGMVIVFTRLFSSLGFIIANSGNMLLRISISLLYIKHHFKDYHINPLESLVVERHIWTVFACAFAVTAASEQLLYPSSAFLHLVVGGVALLVVVFQLRWELKQPIEILLRWSDQFLMKFPNIREAEGGGDFGQSYVINLLHYYVFRKYQIDKIT